MIAHFAVSRYPVRMRPKRPSEVLRGVAAQAMLVTNVINIRYMTGVKLTTGILLVTQRNFQLFVDGRYTEAAAKTALPGVTVVPVADLEAALRKIRVCAFEASDITVDRFSNWKRKFKSTKFVQTTGVIEEFRRTKDADELRKFRRAQRITRELLARVPSLLRRPITEHAVAWKLREWAEELGADAMSFEPIVAFGTHTSRPHHRPTHRVLQKGHVVQVDCGAMYDGYCADQSAVYFTDRMTPLQKKVHLAVSQAFDAAMERTRPGASSRDLDRLARDVLKSHGLDEYFLHSLGHGVGLEVHEGLNISSKAPDKKLLKNEIVTIEPGVYLPGKFGMRLETEVIVGE